MKMISINSAAIIITITGTVGAAFLAANPTPVWIRGLA